MLADLVLDVCDSGAGSVLREHLAPQQLVVHEDTSAVRVVMAPRRTGKTTLNAALYWLEGIPGELHPFIAWTISKARTLIVPKLNELKREFGLGYEANWAKNEITLANGVVIKLRGVSSKDDVEEIRGDRYPFAIWDEVGVVPEEKLMYTLQECLGPALADFEGRGGRGLVLTGTPSLLWGGRWNQIAEGKLLSASPHTLTMADNPWFGPERAAAVHAKVLADNNWTVDSPPYVREWLGKFVQDSAGLCLGMWDGKVMPDGSCPVSGRTVMGIDFGFKDATAFVVGRIVGQVLYIIHAEQHTQMDLGAIVAKAWELRKRFGAAEAWGDAYGQGRATIEYMSTNFGFPIEPCKYTANAKAPRIEMANSLLGSGKAFICEGARELADEVRALPWDSERKHANPDWPDHMFDAMLVCMELAYVNTRPLEPGPTPEDLEAQRRRRAIAALARGE